MTPAPPDAGSDLLDPAWKLLDRIDASVDAWWERRLRGRPALDRLFYGASEAANHSRLWHALGIAQAAARRDKRCAVELSLVLAADSAVVNGGLKSLFRRTRPQHTATRPHRLRQPLTSSFPSGHASAAVVAAALLSRRSRFTPVWFGLALVVSLSRIHVRLHHASDVAAGMTAGALLASAARRILR